MKIVIDIPESIYETIEEDRFISRYQLAVLQSHIRKGVPLPKGHGRLIDVSEYFKKEFGDAREFLDNAMTIIEADTESEDKHTEERTKTHACDSEEHETHGERTGNKEESEDEEIAVEALKRQQWIPVTERLPEVFKQVLICLNDGRMFTGCLAERDRMEWEDDEWERDYDLEEAAAWMELPEPYKEVEE